MEGSRVGLPDDWVTKTGDDLRKMEKELQYVLRLLHEHKRTLEVAVEGKYASEMSDPRVRLLGDALYVSHVVDRQLAQLNLDMQRTLQSLQKPSQSDLPSGLFPTRTNGASESKDDHQALATNISHLEQERDELETLSAIARTLNSTLEFDEVLRLVMERVTTFVGAERGFIALVSPNTDQLEVAIAR